MKVIIAEKPSVARDIARVLNISSKQNGYFSNKDYAVTWALGHLVALDPPDSYGSSFKKWDLKQLPIIPEDFHKSVTGDGGVQKQYKIIERLINQDKTSEVICATDAGREGELIFRYIYDLAQCDKPIKRLWISSQTDEAIREGFNNLKEGKNYDPLYHSAVSRSEADWLIGINATRAYTLCLSGGDGVMSVGRVQTPVLKMIVDRYHKHMNFEPENYFKITAHIKHPNGVFQGLWFDPDKKQDRFSKEEDAQNTMEQIHQHPKGTITKAEKKSRQDKQPLLYDLTELQKDAYKRFKFSADRTLKLAQALYETHKVITYPRTSSRYLSSDLKLKIKSRIQNLTQDPQLGSFAQEILQKNLSFSKRIVDDKKITDHHAIIPTEKKANLQRLNPDETKLFYLVLKRFLAVFMLVCKKAQTEIISQFGTFVFKSTGTSILALGWRAIYMNDSANKEKEALLPDVKVNDAILQKKLSLEKKTTKPPTIHNEASILAAMETASQNIEDDELRQAMKDCGLGTPATRAQILERLIQVGYIERHKNHLVPTEKGIYLIESIQEQELTSPKLTGEWEQKLNHMAQNKYSRDQFMNEIKELIHNIVKKVIDSLPNLLESCPKCNHPMEEKQKFYGCSQWENDCSFKIWKIVAGKRLSNAQVNKLLKDKKVGPIKGFKSKKGSLFNASLVMNNDFEVQFDFDNIPKKVLGQCPLCESDILETAKAFGCSNWKDKGCTFAIWKEIAGKTITPEIAKTLLTKKQTSAMSGFKNKSGKTFSTSLVLNKEGKINFVFENALSASPVA